MPPCGAREPTFIAIDPAWAYFLAIAIGVVVSAAAVIALKQFWPNKTVEEAAAKAEAAKTASVQ